VRIYAVADNSTAPTLARAHGTPDTPACTRGPVRTGTRACPAPARGTACGLRAGRDARADVPGAPAGSRASAWIAGMDRDRPGAPRVVYVSCIMLRRTLAAGVVVNRVAVVHW